MGGHFMSVAIFLLLLSSILIQAYRDLSGPDAWDYWNDQYFSPSLTSSVADKSISAAAATQALVLSGRIGPGSASWFREATDRGRFCRRRRDPDVFARRR